MILFDDFEKQIKDSFDVVCVSIYTEKDGALQLMHGNEVAAIKKYIALQTTKIIQSPLGISDDKCYKSRLITKMVYSDVEYIIIFSSYSTDAFANNFREIAKQILILGKTIEGMKE